MIAAALGFAVGFGAFVVLLAVLVVAVVRFARAQGRRGGPRGQDQ